tara:strand:- start:518 stop:706 length:189 start_codon:yes stop_codon:yes gene_type:complete
MSVFNELSENYVIVPSEQKTEKAEKAGKAGKKKINLTPYVMILLILLGLFIAFKLGRNFIHI